MKIQVEKKRTYGSESLYPVCDLAKLLAKISGSANLTQQTLQFLKEYGCEIEDLTSK